MKKRYFAAIAAVMILTSLPTLAMQVNFSVRGTVYDSDPGDDTGIGFNLGNGDSVTVDGMFDNVLTGIGYEEILFNQFSGNHLTIHAGSLSFNETEEEDYFDDLYPSLEFYDGILEAVVYTTASDIPYFSSYSDFYGEDADDGYILGDWEFDTFEISASTSLPEPGTLPLLAIGLLGSFWAMRRKRCQP
jgi:hypothetical protein